MLNIGTSITVSITDTSSESSYDSTTDEDKLVTDTRYSLNNILWNNMYKYLRENSLAVKYPSCTIVNKQPVLTDGIIPCEGWRHLHAHRPP